MDSIMSMDLMVYMHKAQALVDLACSQPAAAAGALACLLLVHSVAMYVVTALYTLVRLRMGNIELLVPNVTTHLSSVLKGDPGELFDLVMPDLKVPPSPRIYAYPAPFGPSTHAVHCHTRILMYSLTHLLNLPLTHQLMSPPHRRLPGYWAG